MSRCGVDPALPGEGSDYDLLASVPGHVPDRRLSAWTDFPGRPRQDPPPPRGDPYDLDDPRWRPAP